MLNAPTQRDSLIAHVWKVLKEMEPFAMVIYEIFKYENDCFSIVLLDINECLSSTDNCNVNANCANTVGNFTCTCKDGYEGDGVECSS